MRGAVIAIVATTSRSSQAPKVCTTTPQGVRQYLGEGSELYGEIADALNAGRYSDLEKPEFKGGVSNEEDIRPIVCPVDPAVTSAKSIAFPSMSGKYAYALLRLYADSSGQVKVAEFYTMPNAP